VELFEEVDESVSEEVRRELVGRLVRREKTNRKLTGRVVERKRERRKLTGRALKKERERKLVGCGKEEEVGVMILNLHIGVWRRAFEEVREQVGCFVKREG